MTSSFFRTITSSQQIFLQNSYFFRAKLLASSHHLRIGSSLGQLIFGAATFLVEEFFRVEIFAKELLFRGRYFCTVSTFSEELHFEKKVNFSEKKYSVLPTFPGESPFWSGYFFKRRYLLQQQSFQKYYFFTTYFFTRITISQLRFLSTATLPIYQLVIK